MPKIERNIEINAPVKKVWEVLTNIEHIPKWSISVKEIKELEPDKYSVKSTIGDYTSIITERIENRISTSKVDHPDFTGMGYILKEKDEITELSYWVDFPVVTRERIQSRSVEINLKDIKKYVEFIEDGGDPDEYDAKLMLAKP